MIPQRRFTELAAVGAAALFLLAWAAVHVGWYDEAEIVDTPVYATYGNAIEDRALPYRDFEPEYPPGALPAFVVPSLLSDGDRGFRTAFEWSMAACGVGAVLLAALALGGLGASRGRTLAALGVVAGFPLLLGSVVLTRFDLYPAVLVVAGLAALVHGRDRLGSVLLGGAVAVKLYPAVLLPLAIGYVWRRRGRTEALTCLAVAVLVVAAAFLPFLVLAPGGVAHSIGHQLSRPLQIESLGSGIFLAAHHLLGLDVEVRSGHGSQNLHATGTAAAAVVLSALQVLALVWIWLRRPGTPEELLRWSAAALVAFVALGKVLSPQFLIWLAPVVPLVAGRRGLHASLLLAASLVLTQLWFPSRYWDLARELALLPSALVLVRDLALLGVLALLVRDSRPAPARSS